MRKFIFLIGSKTLNIYSHQFRNAQARVAEAMDGAFGFLDKRKLEA